MIKSTLKKAPLTDYNDPAIIVKGILIILLKQLGFQEVALGAIILY